MLGIIKTQEKVTDQVSDTVPRKRVILENVERVTQPPYFFLCSQKGGFYE